MWDRYDPREDDRDRGSAWDRSLGGRAAPAIATGTSSAIHATCSPRTSTCRVGVSAAVRARDRVYEINGTESRMLATIGTFRVVSETDLHDLRDDPDSPRC